MVLLQGNLEVVVKEARNLPNLDYSRKKPDDLSDPFVAVSIIGPNKKEKKLGKTHTIDDCLNPKWNFSLKSPINQEVKEIQFTVKDEDKFFSDTIGTCSVPAYAFNNARGYEGVLDLVNKKGSRSGHLFVLIKLTSDSCQSDSGSSYKSLKIKGCVRKKHESDSTDSEKRVTFIHGKMVITIQSAENLPNLDMTLLNSKNKSDPFVTASLVNADGEAWKVATTRCIVDSLNPVYGETFPVNVCHEITAIDFKVYDQDIATHEKMGTLTIPAEDIERSKFISGSFDLKSGKKLCGKLNVTIKFDPSVRTSPEVPDCVYPVRTNNNVILYQDAHCPCLPSLVANNEGQPQAPHNAWIDVQEALKNAQKFILISGWSVITSITLVRSEQGGGETLGQILWNKALEGVDVRLLLWDELTSTESMQTGAMSTGDNQTKEYFKDSPVKVSLALRKKKPKGHLPDSTYFTKCCYSHHQKTIITDTYHPEKSNMRQLLAFVGGLDLTSGRYDTPDHPLFSTLGAQHKDDFYNNLMSTTVTSGPRQPWHDIHSQIKGKAAWDILDNFRNRWFKQGISGDYDVNCSDIDQLYAYQGRDSWDVQIFRSISEDSVPFFNESPNNLMTKKGRKIDNSIQRAYIHQIQRAQRFIYIENQYFMGSSHFWENCRDIPLKNIVPLEIAAKIVDKIKRGEHFVAYIVIPMFPEGNPEDTVTQEILHWQFHTIEMMYSRIGQAINESGIDAEPQDYLLFFCIGKRESSESVPDHLKMPINEKAALAFKNRRAMIYVHSKMAIFDDEYVLVGSANINDRSLGGTRDTEIAMGAYQPAVGSHGNGDVSTFRKCLWSEHLGTAAPLHLDPGSQHCARTVRQMAEEALSRYIDVSKPLPESHLLLYPLKVERNGVVTTRADCEMFPDTKASVVGMRSMVLPSELTT